MRSYSGDFPPCPKCGLFVEDKKCTSLKQTAFTKYDEEWDNIERECVRCHYVWKEKCVDAD